MHYADDPAEPPGSSHYQIIYRKDQHLSTALLGGEVDYILHLKAQGKEHLLWTEHRKVLDLIQSRPLLSYEDFIRHSWALTKDLTAVEVKVATHRLAHELRVGHGVLNTGLLNWMQRTSTARSHAPQVPVVGEDVINHCITPEIVKWYHRVYSNRAEIRRISHKTTRDETILINGVSYKVVGDLVILPIRNPTRANIVAPYTTLLALNGMTNARFTTLLYARMCDYWHKYPSISLYTSCVNFYKAADIDLGLLGEDIYTVLKCLPSLAIGAVLKHTEFKIPSRFLETVLEDLPRSKVKDFISSPVHSIEEAHVRLELSGLWKTMGHPFIDVEASVRELRVKGTSPAVPTAQQEGEDIATYFKKYWCKGYWTKHRRWPPINNPEVLPPQLYDNYLQGTWDEVRPGSWSYELWRDIEFDAHVDFDYSIDSSELMSDKAMINCRDQWGYTYNPAAHKTLYGKPLKRPPRKHQRVILEYLERPEVSLKSVIRAIETGTFLDNWYAMIGVFKECELKKKKGRLFGKLSFEARLYQTATEHNLAEKIFPYIRGQSMTMSEEELKRVVLRMSSDLRAYAEHSMLFIAIDLSQWCTTWRHESAGPILRVLDEIFGLQGVYNFTQLFSQVAGVFIQNRFWPPEQKTSGEPTDGPSYIDGFLAWLEGLRQKGWTLATMMEIEKTAEEYGTAANLLGQGDNQVICLRHPSERQLANLGITVAQWVDGFLKLLESRMSKLGLVLKTKESWVSSSLFEYSREYHLSGCPVSRGLKLASKLLSAPNTQLPTFNMTLSSLYAAGEGLAAADPTPLMSYYLTTVLAQGYLREKLSKEFLKDTASLTTLLSYGRTVGGLPITPFSGFCYRGTLDSLSSNLSVLKTLEETGYGDSVSRLIDVHTKASRVDPLLLVQDPESLPLDLPLQTENYLRGVISNKLVGFVKNQQLLPLFRVTAAEQERALARDLLEVKPCHPRLANLLYSLSNAGLRQRLLGQFSNTSSLQALLIRQDSEPSINLYSVVEDIDDMMFVDLEFRRTGPSHGSLAYQCRYPPNSTWCSATAAQLLRDFHWSRYGPVGVTMPAPQESYLLAPYSTLPQVSYPNTLLACVESLQPDAYLQRGRYRPYFGSKTSDRVRRAALQIVDADKQAVALRKLLTLQPWVRAHLDQNFNTLFQTLIEEKTSISLDNLELLRDQRIGGKVDHRVNNPTSPKGSMANTLLGFSSHVFLTTDTATAQTRGGQDWTICYQTVFVTALSRLELEHRFGLPIEGKWGLWLDCSGCTRPVEDHSFHLERAPQYGGLPLPRKLDMLQIVRPASLPPGDITGRQGLQVHYARRFATVFLSCLDPQGGGHFVAVAPSSALNISELAKLDITAVLRHTRVYLDALNPSCLNLLRSEVMLCYQTTLLAMDNVLQSIVISGQLKNIYRLARTTCNLLDHGHTTPFLEYTRSDRLALIVALLRSKDPSDTSFYRDYGVLTPRETPRTVLRVAYLKAAEMRDSASLALIQKVQDRVRRQGLDSETVCRLLPEHCRPLVVADEASCCQAVRAESLPNLLPPLPIIGETIPLGRPREIRLIAKQTRPHLSHMHMSCVLGLNILTSELGWLLRHHETMKAGIFTRRSVLVVESYGGPLSLVVAHYTSETLTILAQDPIDDPPLLERLINTGPLDHLADQCDISYNRNLWIASLITPFRLELHPSSCVIWEDTRWQTYIASAPIKSRHLVRCTVTEVIRHPGITLIESRPCPISPESSTWLLLERSTDDSDIHVPAFSANWNGMRFDQKEIRFQCRALWYSTNQYCCCLNHIRNLLSELSVNIETRQTAVKSLSDGLARVETSIRTLKYEELRSRARDPLHWTARRARSDTLMDLQVVWHLYRFLYLMARGQLPVDWLTDYVSDCHCHISIEGLRVCQLSCRGEDVVGRRRESGRSLARSFPRVVYPLWAILEDLPIRPRRRQSTVSLTY
ncbi:L protein [Sekira virus]|uniref:RNA-directed RNA polymerase n=1 Tax=Sekira virus TaxID=2776145 RepID=A0AAD1NG15_9MONO|nr:L protein [Sekira virus]BCL64177.1 L protein [Sekira virus]